MLLGPPGIGVGQKSYYKKSYYSVGLSMAEPPNWNNYGLIPVERCLTFLYDEV